MFVISVCQWSSFPFPKSSALPRVSSEAPPRPRLPHGARAGGRTPGAPRRGKAGRAGQTSQASGRRHSLLLTDDDAQVLEASERVLLGVQHLLGRLLHVPVRLLGEHAAAAAAAAAAVAATADSVPSRPGPAAESGASGRGGY